MKATMMLSSAALFFASALAAPTPADAAPLVFRIQLANDFSGKNADADVPVNGGPRTFGQLFGAAFGPQVIATSLQAVSPGAGGNNVRCTITNPASPGSVVILSAWNTFVDLDGNVNKAIPTDVTAFTIDCKL